MLFVTKKWRNNIMCHKNYVSFFNLIKLTHLASLVNKHISLVEKGATFTTGSTNSYLDIVGNFMLLKYGCLYSSYLTYYVKAKNV